VNPNQLRQLAATEIDGRVIVEKINETIRHLSGVFASRDDMPATVLTTSWVRVMETGLTVYVPSLSTHTCTFDMECTVAGRFEVIFQLLENGVVVDSVVHRFDLVGGDRKTLTFGWPVDYTLQADIVSGAKKVPTEYTFTVTVKGSGSLRIVLGAQEVVIRPYYGESKVPPSKGG